MPAQEARVTGAGRGMVEAVQLAAFFAGGAAPVEPRFSRPKRDHHQKLDSNEHRHQEQGQLEKMFHAAAPASVLAAARIGFSSLQPVAT